MIDVFAASICILTSQLINSFTFDYFQENQITFFSNKIRSTLFLGHVGSFLHKYNQMRIFFVDYLLLRSFWEKSQTEWDTDGPKDKSGTIPAGNYMFKVKKRNNHLTRYKYIGDPKRLVSTRYWWLLTPSVQQLIRKI